MNPIRPANLKYAARCPRQFEYACRVGPPAVPSGISGARRRLRAALVRAVPTHDAKLILAAGARAARVAGTKAGRDGIGAAAEQAARLARDLDLDLRPSRRLTLGPLVFGVPRRVVLGPPGQGALVWLAVAGNGEYPLESDAALGAALETMGPLEGALLLGLGGRRWVARKGLSLVTGAFAELAHAAQRCLLDPQPTPGPIWCRTCLVPCPWRCSDAGDEP